MAFSKKHGKDSADFVIERRTIKQYKDNGSPDVCAMRKYENAAGVKEIHKFERNSEVEVKEHGRFLGSRGHVDTVIFHRKKKEVKHVKFSVGMTEVSRPKKYGKPKVIGKRGVGHGKFSLPCDVAVCPVTGNICIADQGNHRVQIFNKDFLYIRSITGTTLESNMRAPFGVTVNSKGDIIISDWTANIVSIHGGDGRYLRQLPGPWNRPYGVATDSGDKVYVCDNGSHNIHVHNRSGNRLYTFSLRGSEPGEFTSDPHFIVVCEDTLFISDWIGRVYQFTTSGSYVTSLDKTKLGDARGFAMTNTRDLVVADYMAGRVRVISDGKVLCCLGEAGHHQLNNPRGVAVSATGAIIVANYGGHNVHLYNPVL